MTGQDYYKAYAKEMDRYSDEKLIEIFNTEVGSIAWGTARSSYLASIIDQFRKRTFDCSSISNADSTSWEYKIKLVNNRILQIV